MVPSLRGPGSASTSTEGERLGLPFQGAPASGQGPCWAWAGGGPTGEPDDPGRRRTQLPKWQPQTERLLRATPLRPSPRPLPPLADVSWSGVPRLFWGGDNGGYDR